MIHKPLITTILTLSLPIGAQSAPTVAVDIAPLHSLVSQVMEGVGKPDLLIPAEASPHSYTLRPSQAKALSEAEVIFWIGENLTPWLEKALQNVADSAEKVEMLDLEKSVTYDFRERATFGEHEEDSHEEVEQAKRHEEDHQDEEEGHDHHGIDPHAWLDPFNARVWLNTIKDTLSDHDPANASLYHQNAAKATASLDTLIASTTEAVSDFGELKFIVFHDAYQYFEKRFNVPSAAAISLGDAEDPSPARVETVRETVNKLGVSCVFTEPQYNPGLVQSVFEGTNISTIAVMDPLGANIPTGSDHYQSVIQGLVSSLNACNKTLTN